MQVECDNRAAAARASGSKPAIDLDLPILAFFVLVVAFVLGGSPGIFEDGDTGWHLATGQWMIEHRRIPMADPFSYPMHGKPWIVHEWLSQLVMAGAFSLFGYTGLSLLVIASLALTYSIIGLRLRRWASPTELLATLTVVALMLTPFTLARPMVMAWPLLALWTEALLRAREHDRLPSWRLVPLMTLWVNLHPSFALGLALIGVFALEALIESKDRRRNLLRWAGFGLVCAAAALVNPYGLKGLLFPLDFVSTVSVGVVEEFKPTDIVRTPTFEPGLLLLIGVSLWRGVRLRPVRLLLLLGMLHLALAHMRHQALFAIIAGLVAAPAMTRAWISGQRPKPGPFERLGVPAHRRSAVAAVAVAMFLTVAAFQTLQPVERPESSVNPVRAFASITPEMRDQRVLNGYSLGGPLILLGVPVYMDGRAEVYGNAHLLAFERIRKGDTAEFARADSRWRFCWTIFPPANRELLRLLDQSPQWQRHHADRHAVIHVRRACRGRPGSARAAASTLQPTGTARLGRPFTTSKEVPA